MTDLEQLMAQMLDASQADYTADDGTRDEKPSPRLMAQWVRDNLYEIIAACIEVDVEQTGPLELTITSELPPYDILESQTIDPSD